MEDKSEISRRKAKSLSASSEYYNPKMEEIMMASKGLASKEEETHSPSSFQLMEVSRGAQKLNHMIESWSKGVKFDGQSKDIARDLLKGSLDLQDSLIMLGKLQEASRYMSHLKRQQIMESSERGRYDDHDHHDYHNYQLRDKYPMTGFQNPRTSFGGASSRSSTEELKKVIRESLVSQNFMSKSRKPERACFAHRSLDSSSTSDQSPSTTSSSQLSLARPATESPTDSSSAADSQTAKGPNLIAKLMGLEEYPLRPFEATPQRGFEGHNMIPSERRPVFDIDMPKARKPQYAVQKAGQERKTLKEILDTMQFKGLLRSNAGKGVQPFSDQSNASHFKQRLVGDGPPIVLIKPLRVPPIETKEIQTIRPLLEEEDPLYRRKMLRKLRRKEELHPKEIGYKEVNLKSDKIRRRSEAEGGKEQRVIVEVPEEKEVVVKENSSVKLKVSRPVNHKQQKNKAIEKRADEIQKVTTINRKPLEKEVVRTKSVPKSEDQAKKLSIKAGKTDSKSNVGKIQNSRQLSSNKSSAIKHGEIAACNSSFRTKNRTKREKTGKKPTAAKSVTKTCGLEEDEKKIKVINGSEYREVSIEIDPENNKVKDQLPKEEEADIYDSKIEERCSHSHSSTCDATPSTPCADHEIHGRITEQAPKDIGLCTSTDGKAIKSETGLRALLLSSLSFQNHVEELFDLNMNGSTILQTSYIENFGESSTRLLLGCAKELIDRKKSLHDSQTLRPLIPTRAGKPRRCSVSLETLVEEVCRGIEALKKYSKIDGESLAVDVLYAMLETDLTCNGFVNGIWDSGWRAGFFSWDEAEQVVNDIEKLVLSGLIEEVFT
ncbi:hypothetical protein L484_002503 [Morus notabilis]|uniref:Uncharacterized protein n=2 Tax=Morus notabilis TaxID=981085 RepID=W9QQ18_9ROSA|nr:hypothetical protein L484_002503 [Morus notabilis]